MNIPTVHELRQKTRGDLINWRGNCLRKLEEYRAKEPQTEFWENLADLMETKAAAIQDFLDKNPTHLLNTGQPNWVSQAPMKSPFRPTRLEVEKKETGPTYHRAAERVRPPGFNSQWEEMAPKMTPEQNRKRKIEEAEKEMALLKKEAEELKERFQAQKRLKAIFEAEQPTEETNSNPETEPLPTSAPTETFTFNDEEVTSD